MHWRSRTLSNAHRELRGLESYTLCLVKIGRADRGNGGISARDSTCKSLPRTHFPCPNKKSEYKWFHSRSLPAYGRLQGNCKFAKLGMYRVSKSDPVAKSINLLRWQYFLWRREIHIQLDPGAWCISWSSGYAWPRDKRKRCYMRPLRQVRGKCEVS